MIEKLTQSIFQEFVFNYNDKSQFIRNWQHQLELEYESASWLIDIIYGSSIVALASAIYHQPQY